MNGVPFLNDIRGQDHAIGLLRKSAASQRMPHAFLFRGPRGVGKRSTAQAFVRYLLCRAPTDGDGCGRCPSCRKMAGNNHPDIQLIAPDGAAIKIDQIREMQRVLAFPPLEGSLRATIILRAQTMADPAANALLKTLEEPPEGNLFILTSEDASPLLSTILSRCQVLTFNSLSRNEVAEVLSRGQEEMPDMPSLALTRAAAGSPGLALKLADSTIPQLMDRAIDLIIRARKGEAVINEILDLAKECAGLKDDLAIFLEGTYAWLCDLVWSARGAENRGFAAELSEGEKALARAMKVNEVEKHFSSLKDARQRSQRNSNRQAVCELLLFSLAYPGRP